MLRLVAGRMSRNVRSVYPASAVSFRGMSKQAGQTFEEDLDEDDDELILDNTATLDRLKELFAQQCMTCVRYEMFADRADVEGFLGIGDSFRALARSEKIQAQQVFKFVEDASGIDMTNGLYTGHTEENLLAALGKEDESLQNRFTDAAKVAFDENLEVVSEMLYELSEADERKRSILKSCHEEIRKLRPRASSDKDQEDDTFF